MDDTLLLRYSRHLLLPNFGIEGQRRLAAARVLLVGLGGLGSPVALYLVAAGVGELVLADDDVVDLTNLPRQILHDSAAIGQAKVASAIARLRALNPHTRLTGCSERLTPARLATLATEVDLIVDASDNFPTRFAINRACFAAGIALVSGAAIRMEGQLAVFSGQPGGPCYRCLYADESAAEDERCTNNGVFAPLVGIVGSMQAGEALKLLAGLGGVRYDRLLLLDGQRLEWRAVRIVADPACPVCAC